MTIILSKGVNGEETRLMQKALNELCDYGMSSDGVFGPGTKNNLVAWQTENGFTPDGVYNSEFHTEIANLIDRKYIRMSMVDQYANAIGLEPAFLKAVIQVESSGSGFFNNGLCTILFERHVFFNQVVKKFGLARAEEWASKYPNICYKTRSQSAYLGGVREWDRLNSAKNLDSECALLSASFGMFQIMGFNFGLCGYKNVGDYVSDAITSERFHIGAVAMLIKNQRPWYNAAKALNFSEFARLYNGADYASHNYHGRLEAAYHTYSKQK